MFRSRGFTLRESKIEKEHKYPRISLGTYVPLYVLFPDDGNSAPKHVADFKIYIQFVIILFAFVGERRTEWIVSDDVQI
jgi:hypothetical protein